MTEESIRDHVFDAGDHAIVEAGHLCHSCGKPLEDHARVLPEDVPQGPKPKDLEPPLSPTIPLVVVPTRPNPNVGLGIKRWQPAWWNRSPGPVIYEYDWFDWTIRLIFLGVGLLIGFLVWHGVHLSLEFV